MKQLQAQNTTKQVLIQLDDTALESLESLRVLIEETLYLKPSTSVIMRRALTMYYLHFQQRLSDAAAYPIPVNKIQEVIKGERDGLIFSADAAAGD